MLTSNRIKFLDLHFFRHRFFVLGSGIEITSASSRFELNFLSCHDYSPLNPLTASAQISQYGINTVFVYRTQCGIRNAKANPAVFALNPKTAVLQVWQKPALSFVVGVRNVIPAHRFFASDLAYARHGLIP